MRRSSLVIIIAALLFAAGSPDRPVRAGETGNTIDSVSKALEHAMMDGGGGGGGGATGGCLASNPRPNDSAFSAGWAKGCAAKKAPKQPGVRSTAQVGGANSSNISQVHVRKRVENPIDYNKMNNASVSSAQKSSTSGGSGTGNSGMKR